MHLLTKFISISVVTTTLMLTGCASFKMTEPAPVQAGVVKIQYTSNDPSSWSELPPGVYRVPGSQVIISGHQKGSVIGVIFGPFGVLAQSAINSSIGKGKTHNIEDALRINLTAEEQKITAALLTDANLGGKFTLQDSNNPTSLSVDTSVIINFVNDTDVRPYVLLKATLKDATAHKQIWSTRYIAAVGKARPLSGENSWTSNNAAPLKENLSLSLKSAIGIMLNDISSPAPRDAKKLTTVEAEFPYVKQPIQIMGYKVAEDEQSIAFIPKLGDMVTFQGVNILDKQVTVYRAATANDPLIKAITPPKQ